MNQDEDVMRYFPHVFTPEQSKASFERIKKHYENHGYTFFAVDLLKEETFIGLIGIVNTQFEAHFTPCVEIGWRLMKKYWGLGLATEGAKACVDHAFYELDIEEIYSFTPVVNRSSERVMQKIGMERVGTFRHPLVPDHPLEDHLLYKIGR
jgi:RimJ/RimL family protein N-acetyltransferase